MKQKIINENNNGWNGNNQNPWGQNNNRQNFENPFDGLQKIISKFLPGGGKGWKGLIAVLLILFGLWSLSGIYRVIKFGQGSEFYTQNPIFWTKMIVFALVGSLSLYPTITYVLWAIPLSKGTLPQVTESMVSRLRLIINVELVGFASIPFLATLMARGVGLG